MTLEFCGFKISIEPPLEIAPEWWRCSVCGGFWRLDEWHFCTQPATRVVLSFGTPTSLTDPHAELLGAEPELPKGPTGAPEEKERVP